MTREQFRALVGEAIDSIPRRFAQEITNVAIVIEDRPSDDLLEDMDMGPEDVLFGPVSGDAVTRAAVGTWQCPARPNHPVPANNRRGLRR